MYGEQHKSISAINPAITENKECSNVTACVPIIDLKVDVLLSHGISLCFISRYFGHIPSKNRAKSALVRTALYPTLTPKP